jgi:putative ABC transport system substrate-binding protein
LAAGDDCTAAGENPDDRLFQPPAIPVATGPAAASAATAATIPMAFTSGQDPLCLDLVASLNRPGGNATGIALLTSELGPKRLGLLRQVLPRPGESRLGSNCGQFKDDKDPRPDDTAEPPGRSRRGHRVNARNDAALGGVCVIV